MKKELKEKISPQLKYYYKNRERILIKNRAYSWNYYWQHREKKIKENSERYKIWQKNNPLKILERNRRYRAKYPEKIRFWSSQRWNRERGANGSFTLEEWKNKKKEFDYTCQICGRKEPKIKLVPDHIIPIIKGGNNYIKNIQPLCFNCNCKKNDKIFA